MLSKANAIVPLLSEWRRDFHHHPEIGFEVHRTAGRVAELLQGMGYRVRTGMGKTGVVADLGEGHPLVAVRADMDALPIQEMNETAYCSTIPGVMHACGHDAHTAMALGVAYLLSKEKFPGTVRFLFQPSEEVADEEGISGAPRMIADGAMQGVDYVLALHVDPATPVGSIRNAAGPASGGVDSWFATIFGHGGHGARPQDAIDPIHISAHVLLALHAIVSRRLDPFAPAVVSVGSIHAGQAENVIPEQVDLNGTIRFLDPTVQKKIHAEIERAFEVARIFGGEYKLKIEIGTPPMINDEAVVKLINAAAADLLGPDHVLPPVDGLGAEDFGCFSEIAPGAMFSLGCRIDDDPRLLHSPRFDLDESCLPVGTAVMCESVLRALRGAILPVSRVE
jgi:amidohydrolase